MASDTDTIQIALKHHQAGQLQKAESIYRRVLQGNPNHPDALHLLGVLTHRLGKNVVAAELINKAIASNPKSPIFHFNLGVVLNALGKWKDAAEAYQQALRLKPDYAEALNNLGTIMKTHDQLDDAIEKYRQALRLQPDYVEALNNLGSALKARGQLDDAIEKYRQALRLQPDYIDALNNLGNALQARGQLDDAIEKYRQVLRLQPDYVEALSNLGNALKARGQLDAAIEKYQQALRLRPEFSEAWVNLGNCQEALGLLEAAIDSCRQALRYKPDYVPAHSYLLFLMSYNVLYSPARILEEHKNWDEIHGGKQKAHTFSHSKSGEPDKRLKIGYVSPDLRQHAVSLFFDPVLKNHDRSQVEIFCYAEVNKPDAVTERLKEMADKWRTTVGLSDENAAHMIYDDKIDILIDLAGHTADSRLKIFTYKPAPIQVTYLGYCTTTGLKAMDYWITDMVLHPKDTIELAVEKIIRLPRCWICYQPPADAPEIEPGTCADSGVTFGSFNNLSKLSPDVIACWSQLLKEVPDSRLLLKARLLDDPFVQERILKQFDHHGINHERITLLPHTLSHMADYGRVDIALDTFPRTGGVTTADALWMGVPVITLAGQRYIERQGASILKAIGLEELIASTLEDYLAKAVVLANDPVRRIELYTSLRERMANSQLCDGRNLSQELEDAYRKMWHAWCESKANG
jgi:predicted O-linked N-acetylglucosamine transferase (SPINDLY family)